MHHQVRIDFGQRLLYLHEHVRRMLRRPDHDVPEVLRHKLVTLEIPLIEGCGLCLGDVVHGPCWIAEAPSHVMDVLDDTDNLIGSRIPHGAGTEVPADGILVPKKLLGKGFVDDSHVLRMLVVVFVDGVALHAGVLPKNATATTETPSAKSRTSVEGVACTGIQLVRSIMWKAR